MSQEQERYKPTPDEAQGIDLFRDILRFSDQVAHGHSLERETTEALEKFSTISLRIRQVTKDFQGTQRIRKDYFIGFDENKKPLVHRITMLNYAIYLRTYTRSAFNLYGEYLFQSQDSREATQEVQRRIEEIMPL